MTDASNFDPALDALVARRKTQAKRLAATQGTRRIILWHRTTAAAAPRILSSGFRDATGSFLTTGRHRGVWLSNVPLSSNEGTVDGALLRVVIAVRATRLVDYEWIEDEKTYREFLVPAALVNRRATVELMPLDDEPTFTRHTRLLLERPRRRRS